jgi:hypothetical protein
MPEKLREKIKRNEAILADPNAPLEEKRNATVDMSRYGNRKEIYRQRNRRASRGRGRRDINEAFTRPC